MTVSATTTLRAPRGVLAGLVCGGGGVWAHTAVSGHSVGAAGVLVVAASTALCLLLARRELRLPALLAVTGVAQGLGHLAMTLSMTAAPSSSAHHDMAGGLAGGMAASHAAGPVLALGGLPMLAGHLLVAVATALLARGAERAVLDAARRLVERLLPRVPDAVAPAPWRRPVAETAAPVLTTQHVAPGLGSRGPPRRRLLSPLS